MRPGPVGPNGSDGTENLKDCDVASANNAWMFVLVRPGFQGSSAKPFSSWLSKHQRTQHHQPKEEREGEDGAGSALSRRNAGFASNGASLNSV